MQITIANKVNGEVIEKQYPLEWGMGALEIYCDLMECDLDGLGMIDDTSKPIQMQKAIVTLIYAGIKNGCEVNELEFDVTMPKLRVCLDDMEQAKFKAIMDDFANSKYLGKTLREHLYGEIQETAPDNKKKGKASKSPKS